MLKHIDSIIESVKAESSASDLVDQGDQLAEIKFDLKKCEEIEKPF